MKETIIRLRDDISGGEADRTVSFTFDGVSYEIDLNAKNTKVLQNAVAPFIAKARRVGGARKTPAKKTASRKPSLDLKAVREWAVANGHSISSRGRIPAAIVDAFHAFESGMQSDSPAPAPAKKTAAKKAVAKKTAARKAPAKKSAPAKKTAAKKAAAKASGAKSAPTEQAAAAKAPAKKSATKSSAPARKSPAKKSAGRSVPTSVETPAAVEAVAVATEPTTTPTPETASV